jgi:hypothetical protein
MVRNTEKYTGLILPGVLYGYGTWSHAKGRTYIKGFFFFKEKGAKESV